MFRSRPYLEFVRSQLCCAPACMAKADHAHHFDKKAGGGGVACKPSDSFTVPLCAQHHLEVHSTGRIRPDFTDRRMTEDHFYRCALQLVTKFLERKAA